MAADRRDFIVPVTTCTCQGWMLTPVALKRATLRMDSTSSRGTGMGRKARTLRRVTSAQSTARLTSANELKGGEDKRSIFLGMLKICCDLDLVFFRVETVTAALFTRTNPGPEAAYGRDLSALRYPELRRQARRLSGMSQHVSD